MQLNKSFDFRDYFFLPKGAGVDFAPGDSIFGAKSTVPSLQLMEKTSPNLASIYSFTFKN